MREFKNFYFEKFTFDKEKLLWKFFYSFDEKYFFEEEIDFSSSDFIARKNIDLDVIDTFLFNLHIALGISYYKAFPTNNLIVKSWKLNWKQIKFWEKFYKNWLWEFLYINNINPYNLFNFIVDSDKNYTRKDIEISDKYLIPLWWWKDSLVTIDYFEKGDIDFDLYVFWKIDLIKENCSKIIWKDILLTKRKISENLIDLNKNWNYNWHVPITWIIAFVMITVWYIYDYKNLVLSNEKSANSWNTIWKWFEINHQYSKSLEFEEDFNSYIKENISKNINYFSFLRWFYEVNIARKFVNNCKKYYKAFSSCNNNFKIDEKNRLKEKIWCNSCPKCVFVFIILRPYLSKNEVLEIFWEDLFYNKKLENIFLELWWLLWIKPLECVWETEEVIYSLYKSYDLYKNDNIPDILKIFNDKILSQKSKKYFDWLEIFFTEVSDDDLIPINIKNNLLKK